MEKFTFTGQLAAGNRLTDPRQGMTVQHIDEPHAAKAGLKEDLAGVVIDNGADSAGFASLRAGFEGPQGPVRCLRSDKGQQLSFVGQIKRVQPQQFAGAAHIPSHRQLIFVEDDADPGGARDFIDTA